MTEYLQKCVEMSILEKIYKKGKEEVLDGVDLMRHIKVILNMNNPDYVEAAGIRRCSNFHGTHPSHPRRKNSVYKRILAQQRIWNHLSDGRKS
jgi:hypothetical protein